MISPPDCLAQTPSVSLISLSFILWGTPTLTYIYHVNILKSSVYLSLKRGGITGQSDPNMLAYIGSRTLLDTYIASIGSITRMKFKTLIGIMNCNDRELPNAITWIWFHLLIVLHKLLRYRSFHNLSYIDAGLILSLGSLTLTDIDHVSIMKSSVCPIPKRGGITGQSDTIMLAYIGSRTLLDPYIGSIGSKTRIYKETHTWHVGQSHLMRVTWISVLPERRHHRS